MNTAIALKRNDLDYYIAEINQYPLLSHDEEIELANRYRNHGDVASAHKLVVSNLRFVVKIAHQYRAYGLSLLDLIQEGNIGLMVAVKKFDPSKGYRLISYAVWWIRAQIRSFIVRSWSLVKLGTTYAQRKLFFSRKALGEYSEAGRDDDIQMQKNLATELGLKTKEIDEMELRLAARDFSLDANISQDSHNTYLDELSYQHQLSQEDELVEQEQKHLLRGEVAAAMGKLNEKERYVVEHRMLQDEPQTLQEIGNRFKVSRERVRQLEKRVVDKLRNALAKANGEEAAVSVAS
ncbi:MAG: RNA polymerase factor sigma-32 [Deltaproteobacteria bacterium]|nr:RNA polymerase factor sigma-32 [Deltaproteobacteria bacterium]